MFHFVNSSISSSRLSATAEPIIDPPRFNLVYTGNMHERRQRPHQWPVYPCAYREHGETGLPRDRFSGLSLCIQGTWSSTWCRLGRNRFIPVHTGNIRINRFWQSVRAVYPCAYREHVKRMFFHLNIFGLSLCIQGTSDMLRLLRVDGRFIPVHTGNIMHVYDKQRNTTVYPCAYREHSQKRLEQINTTGLSLCIQGTSIRVTFIISVVRFIPVHTGNIPIITYCFIIKILTAKFLPIF